MIWKINSEEWQKLLSNSFKAARGQRNWYEASSHARMDLKYAVSKSHKSDKKNTPAGSKRLVRVVGEPLDTQGKHDQSQKVWNPAEMGDSRIHGVSRVGSQYFTTSFGQSNDRTDWTDMNADRS
ncbi:MAG: hypothetical protein ACRETA_10360 [Gammaproteobacteria bacterium]